MPKIGDALKTAVEIRPSDAVVQQKRAKPTSVLMNSNRRRIFQHLCRNPCDRLGAIANATAMSRSSAKWHLDTLVKSDYVQEFLIDGEPHFCPRGMISGGNLLLFSVLANRKNLAIYRAVLQNPGSDAGILSSSTNMSMSMVRGCLGRMLDMGLLTRTVDGRYIRFFPTERYNEAVREEIAARGKFVRVLLKRLSSEHLKPDFDDLKGPDMTITITLLGQKDTIVIPRHIHTFI
ncbi:MAG: hypothetical protein KKH41_09690 [Candidatus Thermoplasmatota archaeon]|nr:hypothetical protein [Euryarchaeota archaeon]MBU4032808.1 hypothetical protein [Candidatus Thermoplasmatota archaeon]MBU4071603.1 hypothetical protein [Candidatus Thermoplasmatota archaeon]MBU4144363.1 hypothetical protein [Candidatus Thermoplasmatota archaeon]MBU4592835.1 hypothetical protein [Candidatus Thermoplasmatota archaeon]